jgi:hypothetical protein
VEDPGSSAAQGDLAAAEELAVRLKAAHKRVRDLPFEPEDKARVAKRLLALTDASKHDVARAALRLDKLLADLDEGRLPAPD